MTGATPLSTLQTNVLSKIVSTGELKSNFTTLQSSQLGKVFLSGSTQDAVACYQPESKAFQADLNTKYVDAKGTADTVPATCISGTNGGGAKCFWCVQ